MIEEKFYESNRSIRELHKPEDLTPKIKEASSLLKTYKNESRYTEAVMVQKRLKHLRKINNQSMHENVTVSLLELKKKV